MKIEIAKHERMAERGSSLLKLLQNEDTPVLDLLVREAVQNSLDAAASTTHQSVIVDIGLKEFESDSLISKMDGIKDALKKKFDNSNAKALYISDSNTVGLTGPLHIDEVVDNDYGNLQKLVYEISIPQNKEGAGGSWGLGKTIYFRFGIGLVFYYSRIKKMNGEYEHRLAATMVENEEGEYTYIPSVDNKPKRGIAWWGEEAEDGSTTAITNEQEIKSIMEIFSINLFAGEETGTKIVIPFINEDKVLPRDPKLWWSDSIEDYLKVALQRWYAPRIDNNFYPYGKWLDARVNGESLKYEHMEILFKVMHDLYNQAISTDKKAPESKLLKSLEYEVADINLRGDFKLPSGGNAGKVAFTKLTKENLKMLPPNNEQSPYRYLNFEEVDDNVNIPIVAFLRKPGMIVNYEISSLWCNDIKHTPDNEFIVGLFVPNSNSEFRDFEDFNVLENYLRKSEKADHTSWKDLSVSERRITIISRIQNNVSKAIKNKYSDPDEEIAKGKKGRLSKALAGKLLPPQNFGKGPANPTVRPPGEGNNFMKNRKVVFEILDQTHKNDGSLEIQFKLDIKKKNIKAIIEVVVLSESGPIKGNEWEKAGVIGTAFPIEIKELTITDVDNMETSVTLNKSQQNNNLYPISLYHTDQFSSINGAEIFNPGDNMKILGTLRLLKKDPMIQASISLTSEEHS
ncbi:hypothetical protein L1279_001129 [Planomicrobium sp. HSC-17F08]|nr:hypothetical protein [Planomicrobium sp. HSC-17F08]